jgi:hypothetical protein
MHDMTCNPPKHPDFCRLLNLQDVEMADVEGTSKGAKGSRKRQHEDEGGDLSEDLDDDEGEEDDEADEGDEEGEGDDDDDDDDDDDNDGEGEDQEGAKPKGGKKHEAQKKVIIGLNMKCDVKYGIGLYSFFPQNYESSFFHSFPLGGCGHVRRSGKLL